MTPTPATAPDGSVALEHEALRARCTAQVQTHMVPAGVERLAGPLPRNPKGKMDRKRLCARWLERIA